MTTSYEGAKATLKKATTADGQNVFDHMSQVVLRILQDNPADPVSVFENLSLQVKQQRLSTEDSGINSSPTADDPQLIERLQAHTQTIASLLPASSKPSDEDGEAAEPVAEQAPAGEMPDVMGDAALLQWANLQLGTEETLKSAMALQQLGQKYETISQLRWFGKFSGTQKDYIVAEAKLTEYPEASPGWEDNKGEVPGTGANEYVYFVINTRTCFFFRRLP